MKWNETECTEWNIGGALHWNHIQEWRYETTTHRERKGNTEEGEERGQQKEGGKRRKRTKQPNNNNNNKNNTHDWQKTNKKQILERQWDDTINKTKTDHHHQQKTKSTLDKSMCYGRCVGACEILTKDQQAQRKKKQTQKNYDWYDDKTCHQGRNRNKKETVVQREGGISNDHITSTYTQQTIFPKTQPLGSRLLLKLSVHSSIHPFSHSSIQPSTSMIRLSLLMIEKFCFFPSDTWDELI